jgi:hypothetical protein
MTANLEEDIGRYPFKYPFMNFEKDQICVYPTWSSRSLFSKLFRVYDCVRCGSMFKPGWLVGQSLLLSIAVTAPVLAQGGPSPQPIPGMFSNSNAMSYRNPMGTMPKFSPDFWTAMSATQLKQGTIFTGILEDNLSSKSSKPGDLFSIRLQDGYVVNGKEVIPAQSKIIGTVMVTRSAKGLRNGEPGSVDISLQTLVFPDGRHMAFYGSIDHNPSQDAKHAPGKQPIDFAGTGRRTLNSLLTMTTGRLGMPIRRGTPGQEFKIEKGEALPIKASRTMDMTQMIAPPATASSSQGGMVPPTVRGMVPGMVRQDPPPQGLSAPAALSLSDTAPAPGMPQTAPQLYAPAQAETNGIITPADMPDPF